MLHLFLLALAIAPVRSEMFTAMADISRLLETEKNVIHAIDHYIETETARLDRLRQLSKEYEHRNREAFDSGIDYVANPINAFLIVKRLTSDWKYVESIMLENSAEKVIQNISSQREVEETKFPGTDDLNGAAAALLRLQDTYKLSVQDIANGNIAGVRQSSQLTSHDCFELGRIAYNDDDYYHTLLWMQEALNRVEHEDPQLASKADILEYLAFAMYQQGNYKRAIQLTKRLYQIKPDHPRARSNIELYEKLLADQQYKQGDGLELGALRNTRPDDSDVPERTVYEALCRGEMTKARLTSDFYCYLKTDSAFLKLAPLNVEVVSRRPLVLIFRDVLADAEIERVKTLARPRLDRATVQNSKTGQLETASYRISKSAWLKPTEDALVNSIAERAALMTDLNLATSEDLQVANYGLGGHYDPHYDFARKEEINAFKSLGTGNRIATVLFYLSTPEAGGATVFPELRLALFPTKHDAAFWYNLLPNGEGDLSTRHAACPVLSGIKWVSNFWLHERGQEFHRPCELDEFAYA